MDIKVALDELLSIKGEVKTLVEENISLKSNLKKNHELNRNGDLIPDNNYQVSAQQERIKNLLDEIEELTEKQRLSDALNLELKKQVKELSSKEFGSCLANNPLVLRQELQSLKEALVVKDETLQKLGSKFARNREVWLDNERKANEEIKKLDEFIDRTIVALNSNTKVVQSCVPLQLLLEELQNGAKLS